MDDSRHMPWHSDMAARCTRRLGAQQRRGLKRALDVCEAAPDSIALREELIARTGDAIPADGKMLSIHDPEAGLLAHSVVADIPCPAVLRWLSTFYPQEGAQELLDMRRQGQWSTTRRTPLYQDLFRAHGIAHRLQLALIDRGRLWGSWWLVRGTDSPPFAPGEVAMAQALAPRIAAALRRATARELRVESLHLASQAPPGVVAFDREGRALLRDAPAADYLRDLMDHDRRPLMREGQMPSAVAGALARLYLEPEPGVADAVRAPILARGVSGRWYTVHASYMRPEDGTGAGQAVAVVAPANSGDRMMLLARVHGLTARERDVVAALARGESTKQIASGLGVSTYTVQEHVGRACQRLGVRTRRELVARLFLAGAAHGAN